MAVWIALSRPGFEADLARELPEDAKFTPRSGWVQVDAGPLDPKERRPWKVIALDRLIFARQLFYSFAKVELDGEDSAQRAAGLVAQWFTRNRVARGVHSLFIETPDTEAGNALSARLTPFGQELEAALAAKKILAPQERGAVRLHAFFPNAKEVWLGVSAPRLSSPWPCGIPRLNLPADIPSRSARKLEEAILVFIPENERFDRLRGGMRAVDLGAAPGGWSWVLAQRGLRVEAVDNGELADSALENGLVTHIKADGFTYRPTRRAHWLVCDIVTGGTRTARLVTHWMEQGLLVESIFNLKLGGADRLSVAKSAERMLREAAKKVGAKIDLRFKQLYFDRDEITAHLCVLSREPRPEAPRTRTSGPRRGSDRPPPKPKQGRRQARTKVRAPKPPKPD